MSVFQQCPVCNGSGQVLAPGCTSTIYTTCPTCNGTRIISMISGLPPAMEIYKEHHFQEVKSSTLVADEKKFKEISRFILGERLRDPECTLDDIWSKWVNEKNL